MKIPIPTLTVSRRVSRPGRIHVTVEVVLCYVLIVYVRDMYIICVYTAVYVVCIMYVLV